MDGFDQEGLARERGATAVVDCGVSPGLSNFFVGLAARELDPIEDVRIFVGGLPAERRWPYEYTVVFSATDVVEEYTRPELLDRTGRASGTTSMARTTAFPGAVAARLLARGEYRDPGVRPLEMVAADRNAAARFEEILSARGLRWQSRIEQIDAIES